jgi:hypothetical protein
MTAGRRLPRMPVMSPTLRFARPVAMAAALFCMALPALPQSPATYTVEIVVFRNGGNEGALADTRARPLISGDDVDASMVSSRKLGGSASRLNASGFTVLGHAAWKQAPAGFQSMRGVSATRLGVAAISGKVILERDRYLHLGFELIVEDGGRRYHLNQYRKQIRTGEVQYFDHPAIGILAIVTPD